MLPDGPEAKPAATVLPGLVKALDMIGYDAGELNPDEAAFLQKAGAPLPDHFATLGPTPQTRLLHKDGRTFGLVFFPPSPDLKKPAPEDLGDAVAKAAASLRGKAACIIGLSGWGMIDEEAYLKAHPGSLDILLGSGPNAGTPGRATADGKTLWSRAYIKGKTVNRLDLFALPGAPGFTWKPDATFKATVTSLNETYPADPAVQHLFQ